MEKALRYNTNKLKLQLSDNIAQREVARVYSKGAEKYEDDNWRKGQSFRECIGSMKRHLLKFEMGENYDHDFDIEDTKIWGLTHHLAHVAWQAETLLYQFYTKREFDDRVYTKPQRIALDIDGVLADFAKGFLEHMVSLGKITEAESQLPITSWNDWRFRNNFHYILENEDFWLSLTPICNSNELLFDPCCYITARPIPTEVTKAWLDHHNFPSAPIETVGVDASKLDALKRNSVEIFVEDRYENWLEAMDNGITAFLVNKGHNIKFVVPDYFRIDSVVELKNFGK